MKKNLLDVRRYVESIADDKDEKAIEIIKIINEEYENGKAARNRADLVLEAVADRDKSSGLEERDNLVAIIESGLVDVIDKLRGFRDEVPAYSYQIFFQLTHFPRVIKGAIKKGASAEKLSENIMKAFPAGARGVMAPMVRDAIGYVEQQMRNHRKIEEEP
jgi:hypothetical protein